MSVSVIIPAHNEEQWLNRTINNIFDTSEGPIEVVVVLNGYDQVVDPRAKIIRFDRNEGERIAMNVAAKLATGTHLLRIDAHCDFSPLGWDKMMEEVTGPTDMTQAVLTAVDKSWERIPGHRYERCRLLPNYEAKWEKPNKVDDAAMGQTVIPNMSSTGCGFMIRKDFYWALGGASEDYPPMGAIGEEFSVKVWMQRGKVQTRTDVIIGHIFDTGGYDTGGVIETRRRLVDRFGSRYGEIRDKFPDLDWEEELRPTAVQLAGPRTVTVDREDRIKTKDDEGVIIREAVEHFRYIWVDDGTESDLTDDQIRIKYAPKGTLVGSHVWIRNDDGEMIEQLPLDHAHAHTPCPELHLTPTTERDDIELALHGKIAPRVEGMRPQAYFDEDGEVQFNQEPLEGE